MIATTKAVSTTRVRKLSSSIHRRIVHQKLGIYFGREEILGRRCPDWPQTPSPSRARPTRKRNCPTAWPTKGIVAVPSIQVGVKCIGNSITKRSELFWLKSQDATVPLLACGDMLLSWGGAWRGGLDQLCSFDRGRRLCTDIHVFVWNLLAPTMVCRRRVCLGCAPHPPTPNAVHAFPHLEKALVQSAGAFFR